MTTRQASLEALDRREIARVEELMTQPNMIFVFGSNLRGVHGGGAAQMAYNRFGARWHIGEGLRGRSYGIPTKDDHIDTLTLAAVAVHVRTFLAFARASRGLRFAVTRIGCGLAGFTDAEIAPLFAGAPANCALPEGWRHSNGEKD
jgi:hypothetical protein